MPQTEAPHLTDSVYPDTESEAIPLLKELILAKILTSGPLSFEEFMSLALYHEPGGYYTRPDTLRVGRDGDFFTSVSVGPAFGMILAQRIIAIWEQNDKPSPFTIVEPGPEEGQLSSDILHAILENSPECYQALTYHLIEPFQSKYPSLCSKLSVPDPEKVQIHSDYKTIPSSFGIVIANEIFDALPVHLLELKKGYWHECLVDAQRNDFTWATRPCQNEHLLNTLSPFTPLLPEGYKTEVCLGYEPLLTSLSSSIERGVLLLVDYGFSSPDYYHPNRTTGTLQSYKKHRATDSPLSQPGEQDLTTHVDFSRLLNESQKLNLHPSGFYTQESYLTSLAAPLLTKENSPFSQNPKLIQQFRTLTHPSMLGGRFHVLELSQGSVSARPVSPSGQSGLEYLKKTEST